MVLALCNSRLSYSCLSTTIIRFKLPRTHFNEKWQRRHGAAEGTQILPHTIFFTRTHIFGSVSTSAVSIQKTYSWENFPTRTIIGFGHLQCSCNFWRVLPSTQHVCWEICEWTPHFCLKQFQWSVTLFTCPNLSLSLCASEKSFIKF